MLVMQSCWSRHSAAKGCSLACAADILESRAFVDDEAEEIALPGSEEVQARCRMQCATRTRRR